jgi:FkbM family methyltransferase
MLANLLPVSGFNQLVHGRHGVLLHNVNDTVVGQSARYYGEYFESEVAMFRNLVRPGMHVADLGANIGMHTLALARITGPTGWVYAFEAQRLVFKTLCANVALNSLVNVDCEHLAIDAKGGVIPVEELDPNRQVNFGGLSLGTSHAKRTVRRVTLDRYLNGRPLHFMKADIQGMEEACLRGARATLKRDLTVLYLENDQPENSESLLSYLRELDYDVWWHLPLFYNPNNFAREPTNIHDLGYIDAGESYLQSIGFAINILCIPRRRDAAIDGLFKAEDVKEHPLIRGKTRFHPNLDSAPVGSTQGGVRSDQTEVC